MTNKGKVKSKSFRDRIQISNVIMVSIIIICIALFNTINILSVDKYNETVNSLQTLSSFYDNVELMTSHVKDYLYTESETTKEKYIDYFKSASSDVKKLQLSALADDKWRFQMLENMLDNYALISDDLISHFAENQDDYNEVYNSFLKAGTLIQQTSGDNYKLITKAVNAQLVNIKVFKNATLFASIILLGMLLLWLMYYSFQITNAITKPIDLLLKNIQKVKQGKYDLSQISGAGREMEDLCEALNDMALAVENNIETTKEKANLEKQVLEWKNENLKKDELLAQSELKMLQNQINPHFLFNTLNMIYKMAIEEGAEDAADLLVKTSQLLRYGLDKQSKLSDIISEVEMLENYIKIQEKRLGKRVSFILHFENRDKIGRVQIPGMILQPLVENAIKHGLKDCLEDGEIEISITGNEFSVFICVSDNGSGMDSRELEEFIINDYHKKEGNHLGLYNVVKRLQMYYQKNVNISINSDLDCGFEILIKINR